MEIQCECGKFRAEIKRFPEETPGRLKCYCDDCQSYLHHLGRADLLDVNGGTEVIPVYPSNIKIIQGQEQLKCTKMKDDGMFRFSTRCCNTPVANTDEKRPWAGMHRRVFSVKDSGQKLDQLLGPVKASIMGKYGKGILPPGTPQKFNFKGIRTVLPFILKGTVFGRQRPSPFFESEKCIVIPYVLSMVERKNCQTTAGLE